MCNHTCIYAIITNKKRGHEFEKRGRKDKWKRLGRGKGREKFNHIIITKIKKKCVYAKKFQDITMPRKFCVQKIKSTENNEK